MTNLWLTQEAPSTARRGTAELRPEPCGQCCSWHMCIHILDIIYMMLCFEVLFDAQQGSFLSNVSGEDIEITHTHIYIYIYTFIQIYIVYVHLYICIYVCVCVRVYIDMCVCVCIQVIYTIEITQESKRVSDVNFLNLRPVQILMHSNSKK